MAHVYHVGAQDDLEKVTKMAYQQVVEYGMSPHVGHISLPIKGSRDFSKTLYSDKLCKMIDEVSGVSGISIKSVLHDFWVTSQPGEAGGGHATQEEIPPAPFRAGICGNSSPFKMILKHYIDSHVTVM